MDTGFWFKKKMNTTNHPTEQFIHSSPTLSTGPDGWSATIWGRRDEQKVYVLLMFSVPTCVSILFPGSLETVCFLAKRLPRRGGAAPNTHPWLRKFLWGLPPSPQPSSLLQPAPQHWAQDCLRLLPNPQCISELLPRNSFAYLSLYF